MSKELMSVVTQNGYTQVFVGDEARPIVHTFQIVIGEQIVASNVAPEFARWFQQAARLMAEANVSAPYGERQTEREATFPLLVGADQRGSLIEKLLRALKMQMCWTMRDGTPCGCPAGEREDDDPRPKRMPMTHASRCDEARSAIARAEKGNALDISPLKE